MLGIGYMIRIYTVFLPISRQKGLQIFKYEYLTLKPYVEKIKKLADTISPKVMRSLQVANGKLEETK